MSNEPAKTFASIGSVSERLYRAGGLLLVLSTAGITALGLGCYMDGVARLLLVITGAVLLIGCLAIYAFAHSRGDNLREFAGRIKGYWWERIAQENGSALSWCLIRENPFTCTVELEGESFDKNGHSLARWKSQGSCLSPAQNKLFYFWRGAHSGESAEVFEGFGEIEFCGLQDAITKGHGYFYDTNVPRKVGADPVPQAQSVLKKAFILQRSTPEDVTSMSAPNGEKKQTFVLHKLKQL